MTKPEDINVTGPGQPTGKSFRDSIPVVPSDSDMEEFKTGMSTLHDLENGRITTGLGSSALRAAEVQQTDGNLRLSVQRFKINHNYIERVIIPGM